MRVEIILEEMIDFNCEERPNIKSGMSLHLKNANQGNDEVMMRIYEDGKESDGFLCIKIEDLKKAIDKLAL